jgi:endogenous inhibitor of DNA gyrase (YacG/DUF329 family)
MSPTIVKCPGCGRSLEWSAANKWRPFCSERCKLIDLGAWFKEEHAIPGEPALDVAEDGDPDGDDPRH